MKTKTRYYVYAALCFLASGIIGMLLGVVIPDPTSAIILAIGQGILWGFPAGYFLGEAWNA